MNWKHLSTVMGETNKIITILFLTLIMIMSTISQISNPSVNLYGHLGGFFNGLFIIYLLERSHLANDGFCCDNKYWRIICLSFLAIFLITGFTCFFTLEKFKFGNY